jgi:hypothetical protein
MGDIRRTPTGVYNAETDAKRTEAARRTRVSPGAIPGGQSAGVILDKVGLGATTAQPWPVLTGTRPGT